MFKERISPFACMVIVLVACVVTFVGVTSFATRDNAPIYETTSEEAAAVSAIRKLDALDSEDYDRYNKLGQLINLIEEKYVREFDDSELWENVYKSLVETIGDKYAFYYTVEEYREAIDSHDGSFVGIGVHASYDPETGGVYVFGALPDSPALEAGLADGDIIIEADGVSGDYYKIIDAMLGEAGSEVSLKILRNGEEMSFNIKRAPVASENVIYEKLEGNIAYIRILSFHDTTLDSQFKKALESAASDGCEKYIFDVRNNTGGYLEAVRETLDMLLPEGDIIHIVNNDGSVTTEKSDAESLSAPIAVLVNENTASAAELFAAALRDYDMATVVGKTTFGKGSMQTTLAHKDGTALKLTTSYYNPPSNISYEGIGVSPDEGYEVDISEEWENKFFQMPKESDDQLLKAIAALSSSAEE